MDAVPATFAECTKKRPVDFRKSQPAGRYIPFPACPSLAPIDQSDSAQIPFDALNPFIAIRIL